MSIPAEGEEVGERLGDCSVETLGDFVLPLLDFKPLISSVFPDSGPYHLPTSKDLLYSIQHLLI
jgi:hypothetical protein